MARPCVPAFEDTILNTVTWSNHLAFDTKEITMTLQNAKESIMTLQKSTAGPAIPEESISEDSKMTSEAKLLVMKMPIIRNVHTACVLGCKCFSAPTDLSDRTNE